jgi:hypothetical protein
MHIFSLSMHAPCGLEMPVVAKIHERAHTFISNKDDISTASSIAA